MQLKKYLKNLSTPKTADETAAFIVLLTNPQKNYILLIFDYNYLYLHIFEGINNVIASSQVAANMAQLHALEQRRNNNQIRGHPQFDETDGPTSSTTSEVAPHFLTEIRNLPHILEGRRAHFEAKLEPITDPHLQVEWLKDGQPIIIGHRFRPIHDFGYVALDIIDTISEDSGTYTCRATNLMGTCECKAQLTCQSKT